MVFQNIQASLQRTFNPGSDPNTISLNVFGRRAFKKGETFSLNLLGVAYIVKSIVLHVGNSLTQFLMQNRSIFHRRFYLSEEAEIKDLLQRNSQKNNEAHYTSYQLLLLWNFLLYIGHYSQDSAQN